MKKLRPISLATLALLSGLAVTAEAQTRKPYIVQLTGEPVATYSGGIRGLAATRTPDGSRLNFYSPEAQAYATYLHNRQQSVIAQLGNAPITARFSAVVNGFAAMLTDAEVLALRGNPEVIEVHVDEPRKLDTISTSKFLGLSAPGGVWSKMAGGSAVKGENVIIGIVDGGVWPENLAYADKVDANGKPTHGAGTQVYGAPPAGWSGACVAGPGFNPATHCNNKLIGARYFNATFKIAQPNNIHWTDFEDSPRDSIAGANGHGGHGSHTSSTAGGNSGNVVVQDGVTLGEASGVAPRARLASYKVCWTYINAAATDGTGSQNSCYTSDSVAAINQAVLDGVHVINYSISGSQTSVNDIAEQAFLGAAKAGVFVAASAGNSGPGNQVAHISPWLTTVGMSTHDRFFAGDVTLGNGAKYTGASLSPALASAPLISSVDAKAATASVSDANLCFLNSGGAPTLDPAKTAGKIVVCTRGTNARVEKSQTVANAGGVGMIMQDTGNTLGGLVSEKHAVPTIHITNADGAAVRAYMTANPGGTASLSAFTLGSKPAPQMDNGSSRGPNKFDANVLKPDLTAPGVGIIAAVTADLTQAQKADVIAGTLVPPADFESYNGTSMSSPHVAGLAALFKQAHPTWSPMAIKSAMMTTAYGTLDDGLAGEQNGRLPWGQGAGHIDPNKAIDPGLVYDSGPNDWIKYQCKVNRAAVVPASDCTTIGTIDETYNLNLASITVGAVTGAVTVTRRVTNVGTAPATYTATASVPNFTTTVTPSTLTLNPGETKSFTLTATAGAGATVNVWQYGSLTWTDGTHVVKSPVTLRTGKAITAVESLSATTASGSRLITVRTGFGGKMTANKGGLKEATMSATFSQTPATISSATLRTRCIAGTDTANVKVHTFTVPAGAIVAAWGLRQADVGSAGDDHDLGVLAPDGTTWVYSGNDGSSESVQINNPAPGTYKACVAAYGTTSGQPTMTHSLSSWIVTPADTGGKFNVGLPATVYSGGTSTVGFGWSGLENGKRYLGGAQFKDGGGNIAATTILRVEPAGIPQSDNPRTLSARELSKLD